MKKEQDYIRDIAEMRSMMERTTKFMSLSGLAGVMAGIYALSGAYLAYRYFGFDPVSQDFRYTEMAEGSAGSPAILLLAIAVLVLALGTAIFLSYKKANRRGEKLWNPTSRRLLINMSIPLFSGGILILILLSKGLGELSAGLSMIFYGLSLYTAGKFTYEDIRSLGLIQIVLGLLGTYFIEYSLIFWAFGFGVLHIVYGIYMHYRYER